MAESSGGGAKAALLALMVLMAAVAVVVADDTAPVGASELAAFSSCEELEGWMSDAQATTFGRSSDDMAVVGDTDAAQPAGGAGGEEAFRAAPTPTSAAAEVEGGADLSSATGATNVIVEGIDELDRVEQLDGDRMLAVGERSLHLVDIAAARSIASVPVPPGAQVSFDPARSQVWVAGTDGARTQVTRLTLADEAFVLDGTWESEGMLLTGRRSPGGFHAIVTQGFSGVVPFADGPVPCDEVLHPTGPASPEATLIVTLPPDGALEPAAATEIVGAGQFVHLTGDAVIVATALWDGPPATSLHRFDLDTLTHTGSGRVEGTLLNEFALSLHDGHLRVAVTHGGGRMVLMDGMAVDVAGEEPAPMPMPVDPGIGGPTPDPGQVGDPLNEVVVLDTDGDLDVVGRSARFGLPGETLHGIRFVGTTAYAVTFLQTDPFYVLDLADPADPRVVGEVKLPGFSSYLHPLGDGFVVGFGPDGDGSVAAKLFDVTNPAAPVVADSIVLGGESPVAWDHHAFLGLGEGRFAVPATTWEPVESVGCTEQVRSDLYARAEALELQASQTADQAQAQALYEELDRIWSDPCINPSMQAVTSIVELALVGRSLQVGSRTEVRSAHPGERVLRSDEGWVLYSMPEVVVVGPGAAQTPVPLG